MIKTRKLRDILYDENDMIGKVKYYKEIVVSYKEVL